MSFDIGGMGMRPPGVGGMGRPHGVGGPPPGVGGPPGGIDGLKKGLETGKIDSDQFKANLEERFGDKADGIVGEDGSIDFDSLKTMMTEERTQMVQEKLESKFGEGAAEGIIGDDGAIDTDKLKELFASKGGQMMPSFDAQTSSQDTLLDMLSSKQTDQSYGPRGNQGPPQNSMNFLSLIDIKA